MLNLSWVLVVPIAALMGAIFSTIKLVRMRCFRQCIYVIFSPIQRHEILNPITFAFD